MLGAFPHFSSTLHRCWWCNPNGRSQNALPFLHQRKSPVSHRRSGLIYFFSGVAVEAVKSWSISVVYCIVWLMLHSQGLVGSSRCV